jgi:uncharacterized protein (DUF1778 family)
MATRKPVKGDVKSKRVEARITPEQKNPLRKAPVPTVGVHEGMNLGARDREVFVAAVLKPPAPGARLRKAARRYKKQVSK